MKISLLIPTIVGREKEYDLLLSVLSSQYNGDEVEIVTEKDNRELTIGAKRNKLLSFATGQYVSFIDDDDMVSNNYIEWLLKAVESGCDCASLKGIITFDGEKPAAFEHSLKYKEWKTNDGDEEIKYERYPNHLNLIKASIAKQFKFPEKNHGEDADWSKLLHESGLLKTEFYISDFIYHYNYIIKK